MKKELISVLMTVYSAEKYVAEAILSIQKQAHENWELIIVYEHSEDTTLSIIEEKARADNRIRIIKNQTKLGILASRNILLKEARGKYLAILDADDIALPERLATQYAFMESDPEIAVCGSGLLVLNETRGKRTIKNEIDPNIVSAGLLFNTMIANPSSFIRKAFLDEHHISYNPEFSFAEDYALWVECARHGKITNVPNVLIEYRQHSESHTAHNRARQSADVSKLRKNLLGRLGLHPTEEEMRIHNNEISNMNPYEFAQKSLAWFQEIKKANSEKKIYTSEALGYILEKRFYLICMQNLNLKTFTLFLKNPFGNASNRSIQTLKLGLNLAMRTMQRHS